MSGEGLGIKAMNLYGVRALDAIKTIEDNNRALKEVNEGRRDIKIKQRRTGGGV